MYMLGITCAKVGADGGGWDRVREAYKCSCTMETEHYSGTPFLLNWSIGVWPHGGQGSCA